MWIFALAVWCLVGILALGNLKSSDSTYWKALFWLTYVSFFATLVVYIFCQKG